MRKLFAGFCVLLCLLGIGLNTFEVHAASASVRVYVDCNGGTCHTTNSMDLIHGEGGGVVGSTVSSVYHFDEDPTAIDKDFIGWYVYDKRTNAQIAGTGLLTTADVNAYVIPNYNIEFVAQWTPRPGYPVTNITYAVFWNGEGEPCYDVKVTLVHEGISYSGYGFVSIPESIYSTWKSDIEVIWEPLNDVYLMEEGKWDTKLFAYPSTLRSFLKEKSLYLAANRTNSGVEVLSPRRKVHDWYYQASFVSPDISVLNTQTADKVIADPTVVPATYSVETEIYQSGSIYETARNAAMSDYGTTNVVVVDIELKDDNGANVTQLSDYVDVRVDIPNDYVIQPGNTIIVYYLNDAGVLEKCDTTYYSEDSNNRYVTFKTNHFSVYVLVESAVEEIVEPEDKPETEPAESSQEGAEEVPEAGTEEKKQESVKEIQEGTQEEIPDTIGPIKEQNEETLAGKGQNFQLVLIPAIIAVAVFLLLLYLIKRKPK